MTSLLTYHAYLRAAYGWLVRSIGETKTGSRGHYTPAIGWARPYPETSGYLVGTLLGLGQALGDAVPKDLARGIVAWLLSIQRTDGAWSAGLHPPTAKENYPSIFNTGQILKGLCVYARTINDRSVLTSAAHAAEWLAGNVDANGAWSGHHYRKGFSPSYYTQVAWPMLEFSKLTGDERVRGAAERVLQRIATRRREDGSFESWGFDPHRPAFTHTIAYTLRGFLEAARLLDRWDVYGEPTVSALETLRRKAELSAGKLPGAFGPGWQAVSWYSCLTGNSQLALCLLLLEERDRDLRLVNAAAKLVDYVCSRQSLRHPLAGVRGGVPGSAPIWGRYMFLRYPNWAAKYHCDALIKLTRRLQQEGLDG